MKYPVIPQMKPPRTSTAAAKKKKKGSEARYLVPKAKVTKSCWENKVLFMNR